MGPIPGPTRTGGAVSDATCPTLSGDGSKDDPWIPFSDQDLWCFAPGYVKVPAGLGSDAYVALTSDLTWTSTLPLFTTQGYTHLHLDGRGRAITIKDVVDSPGLLGTTDGAEVSNLIVRADNSTLALGAGWLAATDKNSTFTNVASNGPIPEGGGGIVGLADGTTITGSFSTGEIGIGGGGLVGQASKGGTINGSFSNGLIREMAGGLVGQDSMAATVSNSYSTGTAVASTGGLVGANSTDAIINNSYATSALVAPGPSPTGSTIVNSYVVGGEWSDAVANTLLQTGPTTWGTCAVNQPYFIAAFYPDDICGTARSDQIVFEGASVSTVPVSEPPNNVFSLVNRGSSGPLSYVVIVNDTARVTVGGVECTDVSKCIVRDLTQSGVGARRDVTIFGSGTVAVHRFDAWTGWNSVAHVQVTATPASTTTVSPTTTVASPDGTSPGSTRKFTVKKGRTVSHSTLVKWSKLKKPRGSKVSVSVARPWKKYCAPVRAKAKMKGVRVGKCKVKVKVAPKKGRAKSKVLTVYVVK